MKLNKETLTRAFAEAKNQANDRLRVLKALEKDTLSKAKSFVKAPSAELRSALTNEKILQSLQKIGVATKNEVEDLKARVAELEARLAQPKKTKSPKTDASKPAAATESSATAEQ